MRLILLAAFISGALVALDHRFSRTITVFHERPQPIRYCLGYGPRLPTPDGRVIELLPGAWPCAMIPHEVAV